MPQIFGAEVCEGHGMDWDAQRSNSLRIGSLEAGDFFHARGLTKGGMICLVASVTETEIIARQVPSAAFVCRFDRTTGDRLPDQSYSLKDGRCRIDSVEPLPLTLHHRMLDMDRQARLRPFENRLPRQHPRNSRAMLLAYEHYAAHTFDGAALGDGK